MSQLQLPLFFDKTAADPLLRTRLLDQYSTDGATDCEARVALEMKYADLLIPAPGFNRKLVSYQGNKNVRLHRWLKFKEGFSAQLVETLLEDFGIGAGTKILDPFAGSGTALLVAQAKGIDAVGIEVLPVCQLAWETKSRYQHYDLAELRRIKAWVQTTAPGQSDIEFPHIPITESAFPDEQEKKLMWYTDQFENLAKDRTTGALLRLILMSILEDISFTRKDGQYLRWDSRSEKAQRRDARRIAKGKPAFKSFHKSKILDVTQAILEALDRIISDIAVIQTRNMLTSKQELIKGTVLERLPRLDDDLFDGVITSPPYCNRYDYTRTYALELAFLGLTQEKIVDLRQEQLSCTVENRSKLAHLRSLYEGLGRTIDFEHVIHTLETSSALQEVFSAIQIRNERGDLNNRGVIQMINGYFTELAFVTYELFRVCRAGAHVAIVNDNVRYGGENIPVDLLMTDIAAKFGFVPSAIYVLPQRKGNSSQQMGKFGREALRKSILVWKKPNDSTDEGEF